MSQSITQVNYETLERIAKDFHQEGEVVIQSCQSIRQKMDNLQNDWIGSAANKFFAEMEYTLLPSMNQLSRALLTSESIVNQIAEIFRDADLETVSYYKNLDAEAEALASAASPRFGPNQQSGTEDWFECLLNWLSGNGWRTNDPPPIDGLNVFYRNPTEFSTYERGIIETSLGNMGALIGEDRFAELVQQGAEADGNNQYVVRDGSGGALHYDQEGVVELGDTVFEPDNWESRYRPDPAYQNQDTSARISVAHEFSHTIFNGDRTPVETFDAIFDDTNPDHTDLGPNTEEALCNILAYMAEEGENAPGIPDDLRNSVINDILPYLRGEQP